MKQIKKRIGSLLIIVCMVLTMLPTVAFAEEGDQDVSDADQLKSALESSTPSTINVKADITFTEIISQGADHTLVIPSDKTITASGEMGLIGIGRHALYINGGGTFNCSRSGGNSLYSYDGTLNLENITINVNGRTCGIWVNTINLNDGAKVYLDSSGEKLINVGDGYTLNINTGGAIVMSDFGYTAIELKGTLYINGGSLTVCKGQSKNQKGIWIGSEGILKYTSGTLSGTDGAVIDFDSSAHAEGVSGKFIDRGITLKNNGNINIDERDIATTEGGLTAGKYTWNGTEFEKTAITISAEPQDVTVTEGAITGSLSVTASSSNNQSVSYQWKQYDIESYDWINITGATDATYTLPTDLTAGTYKYQCMLNAQDCETRYTRIVKVTVNSGDVTLVNGVTLNKNNLSLYSNTTPCTAALTATVAPTSATDKSVTWQSSNTAVATVDARGKITAVGNGIAVITVTTTNGGYTASCTVTVTTYSSGGSHSGGGHSSGGSSSGETSTKITITKENQPNQPITATASVTATAGTNGTASASISDKAVTDAIYKAQTELKNQGKTENGIAVGLNVAMPKGATTLTATLSQNGLKSLVSAGVTNLEINGSPVTMTFDQKSLTEIQKQSSGNVNITIAPKTEFSKMAKAIIGTRPVYNITVGYGNNSTVSSFGGGVVTVGIPYTPANGELIGGLYAVYVDEKGNATRVAGSAYDAESGRIIFTTTHLSMYGVGYTVPSTKLTDISSHWAKESIDYVVGKGLLSGTSETTFAPDTAMTRGMLVTALGRLEGVHVSSYTKNSFTDVKAGSTFKAYIEWAYEKGIIQGIGNNKFAPDRAITREEIAVIVANFAKATGYTLPVKSEATTYADDSGISSSYKTAVKAMQQAGIMMGGTSNKFNPKSNATRAEVSSMLYRYMQLTNTSDTAAKE